MPFCCAIQKTPNHLPFLRKLQWFCARTVDLKILTRPDIKYKVGYETSYCDINLPLAVEKNDSQCQFKKIAV